MTDSSRHLSPMPRPASLAFGAAIASVMLAAAGARAEPTAADRETARSLMQDGRDLRDRGDLTNALTRFRAADDIMHVPTTGLEVARIEAAIGLLIEARDAIAAIRKTPVRPGDPEPFTEARRKAADLDASLEGRVPALTIFVDEVERDAPVVSIDGVALPAGTLGLPRSIDPGHHVVVAKTARAEATQEIDVREWERTELHMALAAAAPASPLATEPAPSPEAPPRRSHSPGTLTYATMGVAAAGLLTGVVTGLMAWSDKSSLSSECPNRVCPPGVASTDLDSANLLATVSTVSFVLAGVGAGATVASLIIGAPSSAPVSPPSASGARVIPWIGAGFAGVRGSF